jgi:hypothetical protein
MHCAPLGGLTLEAASSFIPEVPLLVFLTDPGHDLRKMILNAESNSFGLLHIY